MKIRKKRSKRELQRRDKKLKKKRDAKKKLESSQNQNRLEELSIR